MTEYPRMLYREGGDLVWEGRRLATLIVADADAEAAATGWHRVEAILSGVLDHDGAQSTKGAAKRKAR